VTTLAALVDRGLMAADWAAALAPVEARIAAMGQFLRSEIAAGRGYQPSGERVFRAFQKPLAELKVLVVGQDPYPNPQHPVGLSFSVGREVRPLPPSLANIYTELQADLGIAAADHGDLSPWADQGVMLLNRVLTVQPGASNSHRGKGWEEVTSCAIEAIAGRGGPRAAILWGNDARRLAPQLQAGGVDCVESPHPSPLSAYRGFFGSRPFSRVNALLEQQGGTPVNWSLQGH
jgi:uracil-DNA glycosylase